ncbi:hypothetical protein ACWFRJ_06075 [Streptomyces sp. NPDC055239]
MAIDERGTWLAAMAGLTFVGAAAIITVDATFTAVLADTDGRIAAIRL